MIRAQFHPKAAEFEDVWGSGSKRVIVEHDFKSTYSLFSMDLKMPDNFNKNPRQNDVECYYFLKL